MKTATNLISNSLLRASPLLPGPQTGHKGSGSCSWGREGAGCPHATKTHFGCRLSLTLQSQKRPERGNHHSRVWRRKKNPGVAPQSPAASTHSHFPSDFLAKSSSLFPTGEGQTLSSPLIQLGDPASLTPRKSLNEDTDKPQGKGNKERGAALLGGSKTRG